MNDTGFMEERKRALSYYLYLSGFCLITVFLFWKCRYGIGNTDESFLLTIPYRVVTGGDKLCYHEWHLSQTSSVFLIPAVRLQLWLYGNTDGILLHFRVLFTVVWSAAALFLFLRLKKISFIGAAFASLAFLLYTPFSVMALSYNSMGILSLLAATVIVATAEKKCGLQYGMAGVFYSAAVLCCPYLAVLYLFYSVALAAVLLIDKFKKPLSFKKRLQQIWVFGTLGILLSAFAYLGYIFSRISLEQLFAVVPHMFNDPEHSNFSLYRKTRSYIKEFLDNTGWFPASTLLVFVIVKWKKSWQKPCLVAMYAIVSAHVIYSLVVNLYMNHIMMPLNFLGIYCALNDRGKLRDRLFYSIYIPGIVYTYCIHFSSNQQYYAMSSASTVSTVASILMIVLYTQKVFSEKTVHPIYCRIRPATLFIVLMMSVQLSSEAFLRYYKVFWEKSIYTQTELIEFGPEKGLIASKESAALYTSFYEDITSFKDEPSLKVLFLSKKTWLYLCTANKSSTYSAWIAGVNDHSIERLDRYYEICKEKVPDIVFVEGQYEQYISHFTTEESCVTKTANGNYIIR